MTAPNRALLFSLLNLFFAGAVADDSAVPVFQATMLSGATVNSDVLIGQATLLIITPSRDTAAATREWGNKLSKNLKLNELTVRNTISLELRFFLSASDIIGIVREKVPRQHHDQTWLVDGTELETALNVPPRSNQAFVFLWAPTVKLSNTSAATLATRRCSR